MVHIRSSLIYKIFSIWIYSIVIGGITNFWFFYEQENIVDEIIKL